MGRVGGWVGEEEWLEEEKAFAFAWTDPGGRGGVSGWLVEEEGEVNASANWPFLACTLREGRGGVMGWVGGWVVEEEEEKAFAFACTEPGGRGGVMGWVEEEEEEEEEKAAAGEEEEDVHCLDMD